MEFVPGIGFVILFVKCFVSLKGLGALSVRRQANDDGTMLRFLLEEELSLEQ